MLWYRILPHDAMHSADYAIARCLSFHLSFSLSITCWYCVETAKYITFSPLGSHTILVFPYQTLWQYCGDECKGVWKNFDFRLVSRIILEMIQDRTVVTMECR